MNNANNPASAPYTTSGIETITPSSGGCTTTVTCSGYVNGGQQDIYAYKVTDGSTYVSELIRKKGTRGALQAEYSRITRGI
jgi:hypothetical protein